MPHSIKVLLIDFYDSFTFNLAHMLEGEGAVVRVVQDKLLEQSHLDWADAIVLSPGPGLPEETHSMQFVLRNWLGKKTIFGVCLGMQGIALHFENELYNLEQVQHGVAVEVYKKDGSQLLNGLPTSFKAGLYHSWAIRSKNEQLHVTAYSVGSEIVMAFENSDLLVYGVQFHPESVLTEDGRRILRNFLSLVEHSVEKIVPNL